MQTIPLQEPSPSHTLDILRSRILVDGLQLVVDQAASHGSYLHDALSGREFLDFYSFFASQALSHNHPRMHDPAFRERFRKDIKATLSLGLWHRRLSDCWVRECPDASLIGRNFEDIGQQQGKDAVDAFFDLASQYRNALKWTTCYGNHRPQVMARLLASPWTQPGFADSGAHLASHAQYNFPLRLLKYVRDAELAGQPFMDTGRAVQRLTGELADFAGLDAGYLRVGDRADLVIVNPEGLTDELDEVSEAPMENLGLVRLVKRNDAAVDATVITLDEGMRAHHGVVCDVTAPGHALRGPGRGR